MTVTSRVLKRTVVIFLAVLILFIFNFPLLNTILTAFKSTSDIMASPPKWLFSPTLDHFRNIFTNRGIPFGDYLWNSIVIGTGSALLSILICIPAAYSMVRFGVGRKILFPFTINLRAVPLIVFALPIYILYRRIGLIDTLFRLILIDTIINLPLALLIFVNFLQDLSPSIEEAARIDF